jgi:hypothetical protein
MCIDHPRVTETNVVATAENTKGKVIHFNHGGKNPERTSGEGEQALDLGGFGRHLMWSFFNALFQN